MKITLHCYIINYYLTQWTDNRMPDKRGTDNRGSTVARLVPQLNGWTYQLLRLHVYSDLKGCKFSFM